MGRFRIALAQIDTTVGDVEGNLERVAARLEEARAAEADLVAFPELVITGYPPEDLLLKGAFVEANLAAVERLAAQTRGLTAVVGFVERSSDLYNAAAVLHDGRLAGIYRKHRLPNYGVFDELRYFRRGRGECLFQVRGAWVGVSICEDIWSPGGPVERMALAGADIVVNLNASPYQREKWRLRRRMLRTRAADYGVAIAYVNQVGGQDELVFDGGSLVLDAAGGILAQAAAFEEELLLCDVELEQVFRARMHDPRRRQLREAALERVVLSTEPAPGVRAPIVPRSAPERDAVGDVYAALVTGTTGYVRKNGFQHVVLGLSGGIDSALVATVAADALGAAAVTGVALPSRYSSEGSVSDARALATALGIDLRTIAIEQIFEPTLSTLKEAFEGTDPDVTEENIQARIRGLLLMALSNKFGWLVLTTGNKSEMATGYATLYGDMAGGFAVLKDVPKTLVYALCEWRNAQSPSAPPIPRSIIEKPPSAELRPDQKDSDSLPPYDVLDAILEHYVELDWSMAELVEAGFDPDTVRHVVRLVDISEYKRRQAPPGVKITGRA
jgi:NAD+ synthase (glutamine-hydrolysing)